jgi:hypothetical protein
MLQYGMAKDWELQAQVVRDAADFFGGYDTLALVLNVRAEHLVAWGRGLVRPPVRQLQRIIELTRPYVEAV